MAVPVHYPEPASEDTSSKQLQTIHQMIDREKKIRAFLQLISLRAGMNQNLYDVVQNINQEKLSQLIGQAPRLLCNQPTLLDFSGEESFSYGSQDSGAISQQTTNGIAELLKEIPQSSQNAPKTAGLARSGTSVTLRAQPTLKDLCPSPTIDTLPVSRQNTLLNLDPQRDQSSSCIWPPYESRLPHIYVPTLTSTWSLTCKWLGNDDSTPCNHVMECTDFADLPQLLATHLSEHDDIRAGMDHGYLVPCRWDPYGNGPHCDRFLFEESTDYHPSSIFKHLTSFVT